jgi:menaquinone-dependent protoporphyrinogen oxidase
MFGQTLIVYASRYGSTKEIAERIASVLKEQGISATLKVAEEVTAIDSYDAVIVGSALYNGTWLPEAKEFLESFQTELAKKDVWVFSSGPATDDDPVTVLGGWKIPEQFKHILDVIRPQAIVLFSGKIDAAKLSSEDYLVSSSLRGVSGDYRNWQTIEGWAREIAFALTRAVAAGGTL